MKLKTPIPTEKTEKQLLKELAVIEKSKKKKEIADLKKQEKKKLEKEKLENNTPKWYQFIQYADKKEELIKHYVEHYSKPVKHLGQEHSPSASDVAYYRKYLQKLSVHDLMLMGELKKYDLKLDPLDRLKSIDKKKFAVVTIFNDNKTTDTGVCHCYSRTFSRSGMSYIVMGERGIYDPEFKMAHFYYYANNPFPIVYQKNKDPDAIADAKLLDDTIEMKVIEALANIDMSKTITFILFLVAIGTLCQIVDLVITLKGSGVI